MGEQGTPGAINLDCPVVVQPGECLDEVSGNPRAIDEPTTGEIAITEWLPDSVLVGDTAGEWLELRAAGSFDLNGLQLGDHNTALTTTVTTVTCLPVNSGDYVMLAQNLDMMANGGVMNVVAAFPTGIPVHPAPTATDTGRW